MADEKKKKTSEELKQEAITATATGIEEEVAVLIKENYKRLKLAVPGLPEKPSDDDFKRIAKEAIDNGEFTLGGKKVTIDQVNEKLIATQQGRDFLKSKNVRSVHELVPNRGQVTQIADAVGDAVYDQSTSLWNALASQATIADNVQKSITTHLSALREKNPSLQPLLQEGNGGTIDKIAQAGHDKVLNPDAAKIDRVVQAKILDISEADRNNIGNEIYLQTFAATKKGITDEVNKGYKEAGFMGSIAKFVGPGIANFLLGIVNFFLKAFGKEPYAMIPSENEVKNASNTVAQAVSGVFVSKTPPTTAQDTEKQVTTAVWEKLQANKKHFEHFTDDQLKAMATQAGASAKDNFTVIEAMSPKPQKSGEENAKRQVREGYEPPPPAVTNNEIVRPNVPLAEHKANQQVVG